MTATPFRVGGRLIADAADHVRRYAGLPWSGGEPEVWAWNYYDGVPSDPDADAITPVDVLAAGALHPGLSRSDLAYFQHRAADIRTWLSEIPADGETPSATLWLADDALLGHVDTLATLADGVQLTLLSKVLHRKRPNVVPLLDRHIVDRYRPLTGERRPTEAWPKVLRCLRDDLASDTERSNHLATVDEIRREATQRSGHRCEISLLRYLDIAVWMETR